jgi:predicted site-specific integrase-resolvase
VNLKEWAAATGVSYATARRGCGSGTLAVPTYRLGRLIMVGEPPTGAAPDAGQTVVYARVSSADRKPDLDRQVARVTVWATSQKIGVDRVVTEVGSALNGHRKKVPRATARPGRVDDRGRAPGPVRPLRRRVCRSCTVRAGPPAAGGRPGRGRRLVGLAGVDGDLVRDVTEILTSLCARLHGRRAAANRARRAVEAAAEDPA